MKALPYTLALLTSLVAATAAQAQPAAPPPPAPAPPAPAATETPKEQTTGTAAGTSPLPAPTPEQIKERRIAVEVDATRPDAVLERRVVTKEASGAFLFFPWRNRESTWEEVCVTPCRADFDRFSSYRVSAQNGISSSHTFTLPTGTDALRLHIDAGNQRAHSVGMLLAAIGGAAVIVGGVLLATAARFDKESDVRLAGGVTGGSGLLLLGIGVPLTIGTQTHVATDNGRDITFLPRNIKLPGGFTLTQKGIVF